MDAPVTEGRFRAGYGVLAMALLLAVSAYAWRGWYARYNTDDYCTASTLRRLGFVDAMKFHRNMWSGRYSYYMVKALPESIGPLTPKYTPAITIVLFCVSAIWAVRKLSGERSLLLAVAGGLAVVFAAIDGTPEVTAVGGPLMWETGVITYMLPIVLYTLWIGVLLSRGSLVARAILTTLLMLVAGGLSETSLAAQGALTAGVLAIGMLRHLREVRWLGAVALTATLIALVLMGTAPGNSVRMSELPPQGSLWSAILAALHLAFSYTGSNIFVGGSSILVIIVCGALLGLGIERQYVPILLLLGLVAIGAFIASLIPSTWMLSAGPPPRALHVSNYFVIGAFLCFTAAGAAVLPDRVWRYGPAALMLAAIVPLYSAVAIVRGIPKARSGAAEMDRVVSILRSSPGKDLLIRSPYARAERLLVKDPEFWTNRCICEFYGVRTLSVER